MKRFLCLVLFLLFVQVNVFAIEWVNLVTPNGKNVALDMDSVSEIDGYYFYNIKFINDNRNTPVIITMQSGIKHPFSARIKAYNESEYTSLNGDYANIALNKTAKLEPVTYDSVVHTCYKAVKDIKHPTVSNLIILK